MFLLFALVSCGDGRNDDNDTKDTTVIEPNTGGVMGVDTMRGTAIDTLPRDTMRRDTGRRDTSRRR